MSTATSTISALSRSDKLKFLGVCFTFPSNTRKDTSGLRPEIRHTMVTIASALR